MEFLNAAVTSVDGIVDVTNPLLCEVLSFATGLDDAEVVDESLSEVAAAAAAAILENLSNAIDE